MSALASSAKTNAGTSSHSSSPSRAKTDAASDGSSSEPFAGSYRNSSTISAPSAYWARSTFLSNLPTLVFGTSSMKVQRSGTYQCATWPARNAAERRRRRLRARA